MNPRIIALAFALASLTLGTTGASAAGRPNNVRPIAKKATPAPVHTTISSISAESISISEGKETKTFTITKDTEIDLKGQKAKVEDLKAGMRVSVSMGADPGVASRIAASDAPKDSGKK